jgi:hypothetical protein
MIPRRLLASRILSAGSMVLLVLGVLFLLGAAGASIDGPAAVRRMAALSGVCLAAAVALKGAAAAIGRRARSRSPDDEAGKP